MLKKIYSLVFNNFYFCIFYIITSLSFVTILSGIPLINLFPKLALLWGLLLSINNIITTIKRKPTFIEIGIFSLLSITLLFNLLFYRNVENLKIWIVNLIILTSVFFINEKKPKATLEKELLIISNFYMIISIVFSFISLLLRLFNISFVINDISFGEIRGLFSNENSLGIFSAIAFFITLFLLLNSKRKNYKRLCSLNLILQFITCISSTSRSALLIFIVFAFMAILLKIKKPIFKILFCLIPLMFIIFILLENNNFLFKFTSGRNELWMSAFIVIKNNLLLGVGNADLVRLVEEARYIYLPGIKTGGLHNIFMQILTANGIIVLSIFLLILIVAFAFLLKKCIYKKERIFTKYTILVLFLIGLLSTNLFESNLLYIVSFISIIFWSYLGYTISILKK